MRACRPRDVEADACDRSPGDLGEEVCDRGRQADAHKLAGYLASTRDAIAIAPSVLEGAEPGTDDAHLNLTRVRKAPRALVFDATHQPSIW